MEIDIHNYETVLIDYFDGNLNALEVAEVLLFLEQHPDIKKEFENFGVLPEADNFTIDTDFKSKLKKFNNNETINKKSFSELIVAQMEGDYDDSENKLINELIEGNESLLKLKNTFQLTKLLPDTDIVYPSKKELKRKEAVVFYLNRKLAAAASVVLIASLLFLVYRNANKNIGKVELAQNKNEIIENATTLPNNKAALVVENDEAHGMHNVDLQPDDKQDNNFVVSTSNKSKLPMLAEAKPLRQNGNLASIPAKPITSLNYKVDLNSENINGSIIPIESLVSNPTEKASTFLTVKDWMKMKLIERGKNNLIENEKPTINDKLEIDPITIASLGAGIVEKTTGKKVFLSRSFDKSGTVKGYTLAAGNFKFERIK